MRPLAYFVPGFLLVLALASCNTPPARISDDLRYRLSIQYEDQNGPKSVDTVISVSASQTYNYGAGTEGWGGLGCKVNGAAIPIPVKGGTLFALITFNEGYNVGTNQCDLIMRYFNIPNGDENGAWVNQWSELSKSNRKILLESESKPSFIFISANMTIRQAMPVYDQDFQNYGLRVLSTSVEITRAPKTSVPAIVRQVLTVETDEEWKERDNVNDTGRFAPGLLAANEES